MGGDRTPLSCNSSTEDVSSLGREFHRRQSVESLAFLSEGSLITKADNGSVVDGELDVRREESADVGCRSSSSSMVLEASRRQSQRIYQEVLRSYEELQRRSGSLEEIKNKILSYSPGSWTEKVSGIKHGDHVVPEITSFLLIGPKGSGKSSLINKISKMFENDKFLPMRAQVSHSASAGEGTTYFLQEYATPRGSNSFCLYDTRSLSDDPSENTKMFKRWMTEGVKNGELVQRASDCSSLKTALKHKARCSGGISGKARMINFVIIVVNGISVLESMDSADERKKLYTQMIATQFNNPLLSFKDDKPVIVVTHGDLLALPDRVRIRVYLGKLLGVPPTAQIFDIADGNDSTSELSTADLLCYCLEHADKNLPLKSRDTLKMHARFQLSCLLLLLLLIGLRILLPVAYTGPQSHPIGVAAPSDSPINWQEIRHLWLDLDSD